MPGYSEDTSVHSCQEEALLGLATTAELIEELHTRMSITAKPTSINIAFKYILGYAMRDLDDETLAYRTVDGDV